MTRVLSGLRSFIACPRGVIAIEFALVAPVLLITLAVAIEMGRLYVAYRSFENAVSGTARSLASFPEYDTTARAQSVYVANALLPADSAGRINVQVTSLRKKASVMEQVFTHTLIGRDPKVPLKSEVAASGFLENEPTIYIAATYEYRPLITVFRSTAFTLTKTTAIPPFFSRLYAWNPAATKDVYVR